MRRSFSIAFAVLAVLSVLAKDIAAVSWQLWYVTNKSYVAGELCVNREKPEMQCNGKCHLAKQLRKVQDAASAQTEPAKQGKSGFPANFKLKTHDWIADADAAGIGTLRFSADIVATTAWREAGGKPVSFGCEVWRPPVAG